MSTVKSSARQPRKWTIAEDQKLREEVEAQISESGEVRDWCKVADQLEGRTNKDCRKRWHNSVAGGIKKGQWSKSEDELLQRGVDQHGQKWTLVANGVGTRSADQCAKRWQQSLDPELNRSEWQEDEDGVLISAVQEFGRHWKDIQRVHFPSRSKNCIKNRYTVLVRRYQNQGVTLPSPSASEPGTPDTNLYASSQYPTLPSGRNTASSSRGHPSDSSSWIETEPFPGWPSTSAADNLHQSFPFPAGPSQLPPNFPSYSHPSQWGNWPTSSADSYGYMPPAAQHNVSDPYTLYSNYPPAPTMLDPNQALRGSHPSNHSARGRRSISSAASSFGEQSHGNFDDITYVPMSRPPQSDHYYQY